MNKKLANARADRILWVDLEMTGLDPVQDRILEVGAIITDWDFQPLATYQAAVKVSNRLIQKRMFKGPSAAFYAANAQTRDALVAQNNQAKPARTVEKELLAFIDAHFVAEKPVLLAGNSIHMDRRFIIAGWPRLDARLHYRMLDVTAWKVVFEGKFKKKFAKPEVHRALSDIEGSIEELQYYLQKVKR